MNSGSHQQGFTRYKLWVRHRHYSTGNRLYTDIAVKSKPRCSSRSLLRRQHGLSTQNTSSPLRTHKIHFKKSFPASTIKSSNQPTYGRRFHQRYISLDLTNVKSPQALNMNFTTTIQPYTPAGRHRIGRYRQSHNSIKLIVEADEMD